MTPITKGEEKGGAWSKKHKERRKSTEVEKSGSETIHSRAAANPKRLIEQKGSNARRGVDPPQKKSGQTNSDVN